MPLALPVERKFVTPPRRDAVRGEIWAGIDQKTFRFRDQKWIGVEQPDEGQAIVFATADENGQEWVADAEGKLFRQLEGDHCERVSVPTPVALVRTGFVDSEKNL